MSINFHSLIGVRNVSFKTIKNEIERLDYIKRNSDECMSSRCIGVNEKYEIFYWEFRKIRQIFTNKIVNQW